MRGVFERHDHTFKRTHPPRTVASTTAESSICETAAGARSTGRGTLARRPHLAVADESDHISVHRIEDRERFHVAHSDVGRVDDVCVTKKRDHCRTT
jgi:acid phosphatase type 7